MRNPGDQVTEMPEAMIGAQNRDRVIVDQAMRGSIKDSVQLTLCAIVAGDSD